MPGKRLILAVDGTWVNSDNGYSPSISGPQDSGTLAAPSNVTRICRALKSRSSDGTPQICYYQGGLGSEGNTYNFIIGGYLGQGIDEAIRQAYGFLANNYEDGDEIFLVGFSRGAFTARSVAGLISSVGLLTKLGMESFYPIFMDWENQYTPNYKPGYGTTAWPIANRPAFGEAYVQKLAKAGLTRPKIPIKAVAVFDTVGSLGVPDVKPFGFSLYKSSKAEYSFINTQVAPNVENAYQALALDEQRDAFVPTVWESPRGANNTHILKQLRQCWFAGVHTSIGGGYQDTSISDITLAWMMTQLSQFLTFDPTYLPRQRQLNSDFYISKNVPSSAIGYGKGLIQRSDTGLLNTILGRQIRTPGEYHLTDPKTGEPLKEFLKNTCEFIHPSVRYRIKNGGAGLAESASEKVGKGKYEPVALKGWEYVEGGVEVEGVKVESEWFSAPKWVKKSTGSYIVEDSIEKGSFDGILAESWDGVGAWLKL
ncbi:hypothetical protein HII31_01709 [Pseudocercospora fuligena]|uniref:T6SS Phospholipase effector Tle1-like catalytic domain-containing protein n=1 Tax=Pseudocercospora fuligena TaxID=685502 RepID=A0A8H6RV57_9PEZI|nr:hypothetical protein HII31_01709 [Pseudocercospora fuligena]